MKKLLFMSGAMLLSLAACNDDYNDQFDIDSSITDVKNGQFTLTDEDYAIISNLPANEEIALALDPEENSYVNALKEVGKKKYFNNMIPAEQFIPAFLVNKYPNADDGSRFVITAKTYKESSGYLKDFKNVGIYDLSSSDYKAIWGNYTHALFLSPASVSKIPALLSENVKDASDGDMKVVNYVFSETEPSTGGDAPIIYKQVYEFDGKAANYVIAAKGSDGKYYPFGKLENDSYNYGYMKPAPINVENGIISGEDGADQVVALEKTANGFALQNGWGKYIYMKDNYDSFNMSSSLPTSAGEWSVKANGDGTFAITNIEKNKTVKLNYFVNDGKGSYSFGAYASEKFAGATYYEGVTDEGDGGFIFKDVTLPEGSTYVWKYDTGHKCWKASAFINGKNKPSESYLVSQTIDLKDAKKPVLNLDMTINFLKGGKREEIMNIYVSENYTGNVSAAKWNEVTVPTWPKGNSWDAFASGNVDLSAYNGKQITIAFRYKSSEAVAPTWQIKNVSVKELSAYWDVCLFKETVDDGTEKSRAYTRSTTDVAPNTSALYVYNDHAWKLYTNPDAVVAVVEPSVYASVGADEIKTPESVLPVFLKNKYPYAVEGERVAVVYNHKANTPVVVEYTLKAGLWAETPEYEVAAITFVRENGVFIAQMSTYIDETFLGNEGGFIVQNVNLGGLNYIWQNTSNYGWKASAFATNVKHPSDSWLVSPAIDFRKAVAPEIVFDEAHRFVVGELKDFINVKVSTDYKGDVTACTWETLPIEGWSEGQNWDFVTVQPCDLSKYVGQTIYIAFQYMSNDVVAPTWEIKNLKVVEHED